MQWNDLILKRKTTYSWSDKIPDKQLIDEIIREIHEFCPSKQRKVPFYIDLIDNREHNYRPIAYKILLDNKSIIQDIVVQFIKDKVEKAVAPFNGYQYDESKCIRDVGYVISGYANDLRYETNKNTCYMASSYWKKDVPQVRQHIEVIVHAYIKEILVTLLQRNNAEAEAVTEIQKLADVIISVIKNGTSDLPEILPGRGNLRHDIFHGTDRKGDGVGDDIRNPQVLAPWLLAFSIRNLDDNSIGLNTEMKDPVKARLITENEIGLASMFAVLSATSKGLNTGFCACIRNGSEIAERLGHRKNEPVILYLGIGYELDGYTYYNPVIHKKLLIPNRDYDTKPPLDIYFKEITT
jgi:hypothetical protein